ncbi:MAG: hypothetical protein U0V70_02535 [Terriglobia bacterium]
MKSNDSPLSSSILKAWSTNNRTMIFLVQHLPAKLWEVAIPGMPRRTIRMLAGHIHNARCMWIKTLGSPHGIPVPASVDRRQVSRAELVRALKQSGRGIAGLLTLGLEHGGQFRRRRPMPGAICPSMSGMCWLISLLTRAIIEARSY